MSFRCSHEGADSKSWIKVTFGDLGENHKWLIWLFLRRQEKCNQQEASNFTQNWPDLPKLMSTLDHIVVAKYGFQQCTFLVLLQY